jgi:hypothetical protein
LGIAFGKELGGYSSRGPEDEKERNKLPDEHDPGDREMAKVYGLSYDAIKDGESQLESKEVGVVREEQRIEIGFDGGKVDAIVLHAGVIAHDEEAEYCETKSEGNRAKKARLSHLMRPRTV